VRGCRGLGSTAVDPTLPPCASAAFRTLEPKPWLARRAAGSDASPAPLVSYASRLALLAACACAACGLAAVAWQRHRRLAEQQATTSSRGVSQHPRAWDRLVPHEPQHSSSYTTGSIGYIRDSISSLQHQASLLAGWGLTRRDRLEGVLNSELPGRSVGATGSSSSISRGGMQMHPIRALAHQASGEEECPLQGHELLAGMFQARPPALPV